MHLKKELQKIIKGEVKDDKETLRFYSGDASAFRVMPRVVVFPEDVESIKKLVRFVHEHKAEHPELSITVRAGGSCMSGGPLNESIIVDTTKHLNQIKEITDEYVTGQVGVCFADVEPQLEKRDVMYPTYPASKEYVALGGIVSNNAGGEKTLKYGQTVDYVQSLKAVLRDGEEYEFSPLSSQELEQKKQLDTVEGEVYRELDKLIKDNYSQITNAKPDVSKNSTGFFLWDVYDKENDSFNVAKLFAGSQGVLGVITEVTLGLVPIQPYSQMVVAYMRDVSKLSDIVNKVLEFKPTSLESYDDKTLKLALKYAPRLARLISKDNNLLKLGWQLLPDFWIMLKNLGLPKMVLMVEFEGGDRENLEQKAERLKEVLEPFGLSVHVPKSEEEAKKYWTIRRKSFDLLRKQITGKQAAPFVDDMVVKPEKMPEFLPKLNAILGEYEDKMMYTIAGHAGNGNFHIIPLMDLTERKSREIIPEVAERVYDLTLEYNGSLSAEHNEGLIRSPYMKQMYGEEIYQLFERTQEIFDPQNIFNPHKKTDADLEYSMKHIKKDNEHAV